jgi:hypothetical protein
VIISALLCADSGTVLSAQEAQRTQEKLTEKVEKPELRAELLRRVEVDQQARMKLVKWMKESGTTLHKSLDPSQHEVLQELTRIDQENTQRLQQIIDEFGWPGRSMVGVDGAHAAWLLLQHADRNPEFQKKGLKLMEQAPAGEVSLQDVAYLTDRVSMKQTGKQVYGTQVRQVDGKWEPQPLVDADAVDKRRAEAGLPPLAEYLKLVEKMYSAQPTKSDKQ